MLQWNINMGKNYSLIMGKKTAYNRQANGRNKTSRSLRGTLGASQYTYWKPLFATNPRFFGVQNSFFFALEAFLPVCNS
jgi:hypothetical protein